MRLPESIFIGLLALNVLTLVSTQVADDDSSKLKALEEKFFEWRLEQAPEFGSFVGVTDYNDKVTDMSMEAFDKNYFTALGFLEMANGIWRTRLSQSERYSFDTLTYMLSNYVRNYDWRLYGALNPVSFLDGVYLEFQNLVDMTHFDTGMGFWNYSLRLDAYPKQIEDIIRRMTLSIQLGSTLYYVSVEPVPGQIQRILDVRPEDSVLYKPFTDKLPHISATQEQKDSLQAYGLQNVRNLWKALEILREFIRTTYLPHTRPQPGVGSLAGGKGYYRACLAWHLSLDTSPEEVHNTGQKEVFRIARLMKQVMRKQNFTGTIQEYNEKLKEDSRFHRDTPEEIIDYVKDLIFNKISPKLSKVFKDIPVNTIEVKPMPYDGPGAMYVNGADDGSRPGTYYVNLMRPSEILTFSLVPLTLHEAMPGHHLQMAYQGATDLPKFQKHIDNTNLYEIPYHFSSHTAYTEGWALYAEYLGDEMGVYTDDYERMGRYGEEIFRACRLVVDTGMHYFGWSRQKAVDYLRAHTLKPLAEIEIEVDRYLTWPGQACAYKVGELKIKELRQRATVALGSKFDVRDFHSLLLKNGPVPLKVLETIVDDYIGEMKQQLASKSSETRRLLHHII